MNFLGIGKKNNAAEKVVHPDLPLEECDIQPYNGCEVRINVDWASSGVQLGATGVIQSIETNGFYVNYVLNGRILFHPFWHWMSFVAPVSEEAAE